MAGVRITGKHGRKEKKKKKRKKRKKRNRKEFEQDRNKIIAYKSNPTHR